MPLVTIVEFWVDGIPKPQGSKKAMMPRGHKHPIVIEMAGEGLKLWRKQVNEAAQIAMIGRRRIDRPAAAKVWIQFVMPRPKAMSAKRPTPLCVVSPDLDKLARAAGDALSKVCYDDDSQINAWHIEKRTAEPDEATGALVTIYREELADDAPQP